MVLSSYDDEIHILGSVHHVLKIGSHLSSQIKNLQWLTIRNDESNWNGSVAILEKNQIINELLFSIKTKYEVTYHVDETEEVR